jgi:hypothetical protein
MTHVHWACRTQSRQSSIVLAVWYPFSPILLALETAASGADLRLSCSPIAVHEFIFSLLLQSPAPDTCLVLTKHK